MANSGTKKIRCRAFSTGVEHRSKGVECKSTGVEGKSTGVECRSICKINLGLNVIRRREDGFHEIKSLIYPVSGLYDTITVEKAEQFSFATSGRAVDCEPEQNLCVRAFRLMQQRFGIGNASIAMHKTAPTEASPSSASIAIHKTAPTEAALNSASIAIHKTIPTGAGLGGGSANATTVLMLCNDIWQLGQSEQQLENLAAELGSDTPFFVRPQPQIATGRGEILHPYSLSLKGLWLMIITPPMSVSTAQAYANVTPCECEKKLEEVLRQPITEWRTTLKNDFEPSVFAQLPYLAELKQAHYDHGAVYASMSGSGSSIFGLFNTRPTFTTDSQNFTHIEQLP